MGTLLAFSTFWAGFIARPLGGLVFGYVGDRVGRKPAVVSCLVQVTAGTFLIGVLPSSAQIGVAAPILLVVLRFMQGIAVGGQWGGVILLLTESAMPGRRGRAGTFGQMGVPGGLLLGTVVFLVVAKLVPGEAFMSWGWRIPFLLSAVLLPVVIFIQAKVEDTPVFRELKETAEENKSSVEKAPIRSVIRTDWRKMLLGAGVLFSSNAIFYVGVAGILDYGTRDLGLSRESLLLVSLLASILGVGVIYLAGSASDRIGRKPLMVAGTALLVLWSFPYFWLVDTKSLVLIFVAVLVGGIGSSMVYGPYAAFLAELFEPRVRYSGMSISYQLTAIIISGGTPFAMTALLAEFGTSSAVSVFLLVIGLVALGCALAVQETLPPSARVGKAHAAAAKE